MCFRIKAGPSSIYAYGSFHFKPLLRLNRHASEDLRVKEFWQDRRGLADKKRDKEILWKKRRNKSKLQDSEDN